VGHVDEWRVDLAQGQVYAEPNLAWKIVGGGDFAGTSFDNQLLWRNDTTGLVYQQTVTYAAGKFSVSGSVVYNEPNLDWEIVGTADLDADGRTDIVYRNQATGVLWLLMMNGPAVKAQGPFYREPDLNWKVVALNDFNNDGYGDLLWRHDISGAVFMQISPVAVSGVGTMVQGDADFKAKAVGPVTFPQSQ
jgi:peptidyl-Asp metalloendopeptidase